MFNITVSVCVHLTLDERKNLNKSRKRDSERERKKGDGVRKLLRQGLGSAVKKTTTSKWDLNRTFKDIY